MIRCPPKAKQESVLPRTAAAAATKKSQPAAPRAATTRRRSALLEAAKQEFLEHGFERATLDAVIARAGGSRKTIYDQFGDKAGLFKAVIRTLSLDRLQELACPFGRATAPDAPPEEVLRTYATALMRTLLTPDMIALYRIVIAEAPRFSEVSKSIFQQAAEPAADQLAEYLQEAARRGKLSIANPGHAARVFSVMMFSHLHIRCLLEPGFTPTQAEIAAHARLGTELFLQGTLPRD
jgi:AcrR family transcriptional regulator